MQGIHSVQEEVLKCKQHIVIITRSHLLTSSEKFKQGVKLIENIYKIAIVCTNQLIEKGLEIDCNILQGIFFGGPNFIRSEFFKVLQ